MLKRIAVLLRDSAARIGLAERRKGDRVSAKELSASCGFGVEDRKVRIKDISPTGAYLLTSYRWIVGARLLLTLQSKSRIYRESPSQVRLMAKVVRVNRDGVGVSFVQENLNGEHWITSMFKAASLNSMVSGVRMFQMAKALGFLLRYAPSAEDEILRLFSEGLSEEQIDKALDVVLWAEDRVSSRTSALNNAMPPNILVHIIKEASKGDQEPMMQCWAGLLAAFSLEGASQELMTFCALLSKLESVDVRLLAAAVRKAIEAGIQSNATTSYEYLCKIDEMKRIAHTKNAVVIECALNRLHEFGLLELTVKPFGFEVLDYANLTPTELGLALNHFCSYRSSS